MPLPDFGMVDEEPKLPDFGDSQKLPDFGDGDSSPAAISIPGKTSIQLPAPPPVIRDRMTPDGPEDEGLKKLGGDFYTGLKNLPGTVSKYALADAADAAAALTGHPQDVGNLAAAWNGKELPITQQTREMAQEHPLLAGVSKTAQGLAESAPMFATGALPESIGKLVSLGFTADMLRQAPEQARMLGEEMGKPPADRDMDKLTTAVSGLVQTAAFAPMTALHGAGEHITELVDPKTAVIQKLSTALENAPLIRPSLPDFSNDEETPKPAAAPTPPEAQSPLIDQLRQNRDKTPPFATIGDTDAGSKLDELQKALLASEDAGEEKSNSNPVNDPNETNPTRSEDLDRFNEIQQQMKNASVGDMDTPEFQQLWAEQEAIKNRYEGRNPNENVDEISNESPPPENPSPADIEENNPSGSSDEGEFSTMPRKQEAPSLQMATIPGAKEFIEQDVIPTVKKTMQDVGETAQGIRELLSPASVDAQSKQQGGIVRENAAELARKDVQARAALKAASKALSKQSDAENLDFMHRMETGVAQKTPELDGFSRLIRAAINQRVDQVQALGNGKLQHLIQNYFPHLWTPDSVAALTGKPGGGGTWGRIFGKRPLEGSKSFLKARSIPTIREGIAKGLVPISYNPVELTLAKLHEMDKYVMGQKILGEMKDNGLVKYVKATERAPEYYTKIDDRIAQVTSIRPDSTFGNPPNSTTVKGMPELVIRGHYYAPDPVARILNNYLSPGLAGNPAYDMWRKSGNLLNMAQLGFSGYHATFTGIDSATSKLALGIEQMSRGNPLRGLGNIAKGIGGNIWYNPIENFLRGSRVLKEYTTPGSVGGETAKIVEALVKSGGRVRMDRFYSNSAMEGFWKALKSGNIFGASTRSPGAIIEAINHPLMEIIVPRMKLGIFADMAKYEMEKNPNGDMREIMGKLWDSVDNRMGQMVYDNLFWNKVLKDLSMASVRSVGWNLGTIRELGGAAVDSATVVKRMKAGDPVVTHKMAYAMALPIMVGTLGAMYQYSMTGKGPQELKDYFLPLTGRTNPDGSPERVVMPSYMKDVLPIGKAYSNNGIRGAVDKVGQMALNKANPIISMISQMLHNKDYYGTEIANHDDPVVKQAEDYAKFIGSQFVPFTARNFSKMENPTTGTAISSFFGMQKPNAELMRTKAMQRMSDYYSDQQKEGGKSSDETAVYTLKKDILDKLRNGADQSAAIHESEEKKEITPKQADNLYRLNALRKDPSALDGRNLAFKHLPNNIAVKVYADGTPEEKSMWESKMQSKQLKEESASNPMPIDKVKRILQINRDVNPKPSTSKTSLESALDAGNQQAIKDEYQKLIAAGKKPLQIITAFQPSSGTHLKMFQSRKEQDHFIKTATPEELKTFEAAKQQSVNRLSLLLQAINQKP